MSVIDILSNGNYIVVNKKIASDLGLYEAILLGELASEHKYWSNTEKLEDGFFYSTVEKIKENTTLSKDQQRSAMNTLKEKGIVTVILKGIPAKRYIRINEDAVIPYILDKFVQNGLTSSYQTSDQVVVKHDSKLSENTTTSCRETEQQVVGKYVGNNNNNNNNNKQESKKESIKERKHSGYDEILAEIPDDALRETYLDYIKMRKMIKAPMTDRALRMLIGKVEQLEPGNTERQKLLLDTAILNNWKSVYPLKDNQTRSYGRTAEDKNAGYCINPNEDSLDDLFT